MKKDQSGKLPRSMSHDSYIATAANNPPVKHNLQNQSLGEKSIGNTTSDLHAEDNEMESADYARERNRLQKLQLAKAAMNNYLHRLTKEWPTPVPEFIIEAANIKMRTMASNHYSPGDAPFKKGWLKIAKRRWWFPDIYSEQYVILDEDSLSIYQSPQQTSKPPNLKIPLSTVLRSEPLTSLTTDKNTIEENNLRIGFELHTSDRTQYVLLADTQENVSEWVCAIELCVVFDVCNKFCQEVARASPEVISDPDALARMLNPPKDTEEDEAEEEEAGETDNVNLEDSKGDVRTEKEEEEEEVLSVTETKSGNPRNEGGPSEILAPVPQPEPNIEKPGADHFGVANVTIQM
eukprot:TRINITY_DN2124_c0_g1_i1.p1 TRINITY_DN2124_c0_g1~~TRINITY_DN2124_c0_g1_i1.p1  ORF type:complete len:349 (-),score=84.63 TRINITY_DN2124_c0_g1_i1:27-1073(-)